MPEEVDRELFKAATHAREIRPLTGDREVVGGVVDRVLGIVHRQIVPVRR